MIRVLGLLLFILPCNAIAQTIISGSIRSSIDENGVIGVVVKIVNNGTVEAYCISNNDGKFELKTNSKATQLKLAFEHLSHNTFYKTITNESQNVEIVLTEKTFEIGEVTVSSPKLRQRGDTLSYNLSSFKGLGDISLEDAIKNLPGISVTASGAIQYMGKEINKFYIEGLDMLGGRYNVATKNLPADAVTTVQVIENHQAIKQLENRVYSDNVAINIKLNQKAKLRPFGTSEAGIGYGEEGFLYRLALTGMMFTSKFQTISSAKIGNIGAQGSAEVTSHFDNTKNLNNNALSVLGNIGSSTPGLKPDRYKSVRDRLVSINTINKLSTEAVFKTNIDYPYNENSYEYGTISNYYTETDNVTVNENVHPLSRVHKPALSLEYNLNNSSVYIQNSLSAKSRFETNDYRVINNSDKIEQNRQATSVDVTNYFELSKRVKDRLWSLSSTVGYVNTPKNIMNFIGVKNVTSDFNQSATGSTFITKEDFSFSFQSGEYFRVTAPVSLQYTYDQLNTDLAKGAESRSNHILGHRFSPSFSPQLEVNTPNNRFTFRFNAPFTYTLLDYNSMQSRFSKILFDPNIYANLAVSPALKLQLMAGINHEIGDLVDLLVQPMQVNYRTQEIRSGTLAHDRTEFASLRAEYKRPLDFLFVNAMIGYSNLKRNLLPSQSLLGEDLVNSTILWDNNSRNLNSSLSATKIFQPIKTKLTLGGTGNWSQGYVEQQGTVTDFSMKTLGLQGGIVSRPWNWIEFDYSANVNWRTSKYSNNSQTLVSHSHLAKLSIFPTPKMQLYSTTELMRNEVTQSVYKSMLLSDLGVSYKFKSMRLGFVINNISDSKQYDYTIFNGLDNFTYNYPLRGREYIFSIMLK